MKVRTLLLPLVLLMGCVSPSTPPTPRSIPTELVAELSSSQVAAILTKCGEVPSMNVTYQKLLEDNDQQLIRIEIVDAIPSMVGDCHAMRILAAGGEYVVSDSTTSVTDGTTSASSGGDDESSSTG